MTHIMQVKELTYCSDNNSKGKRGFFRLGPINLNVDKGETIAVIGENRSGKSLLAKLLVGAITADSGDIELNEHKYAARFSKRADQKKRTRDIRMILQHTSDSMNPAIPVGRILDEPLRLNTSLSTEQRRNFIEETLLKVGLLREHYYFYRHMLSDGQQQRVALARAIMLEPKVLVADEPFAALDPTIRSQTVNLILKLQKEMGMAFIFISHNLGIVRHIADRIIVMENGNIVEEGKTETLFRWPQHPRTKKLIMAYSDLVPKQSLNE